MCAFRRERQDSSCEPRPSRLWMRLPLRPPLIDSSPLGTSLDRRQTWLLVDPHQISRGVTKRRYDLTGVLVNGFNDLAAGRDDGVSGRGRAGNHDVDHQAGLGRDRPPEDPGAADLADGVVERGRAVPSLSNAPAEGAPVERGRLLDI